MKSVFALSMTGLFLATAGARNCGLLFAGLMCGYLFVTLTESFMHDRVLHARRPFRALQARYPRLFFPLMQGFRSHTEIHHGRTFRKDHVTQFDDASHVSQVDAALSDRGGRRIIKEDYGMTIKFRSIVFFLAPITPVIVTVAWLAHLAFTVGVLIPAAIYPLMSKVIHPYLHMRYDDALIRAPWYLRPILRSRYVRLLWRHHWLHHRYTRYNFNLLLGGDLMRGVFKSPSPTDLAAMREIGIPVD